MSMSSLWKDAMVRAKALALAEGGPASSGTERVTSGPGCVGHYMIRGLLAVGAIRIEDLGDTTIEGNPMPCTKWMAGVFRKALVGFRRNQVYWVAADMVRLNDLGYFESSWHRLAKAGRLLERLERAAEVEEVCARLAADDVLATIEPATAPVERTADLLVAC